MTLSLNKLCLFRNATRLWRLSIDSRRRNAHRALLFAPTNSTNDNLIHYMYDGSICRRHFVSRLASPHRNSLFALCQHEISVNRQKVVGGVVWSYVTPPQGTYNYRLSPSLAPFRCHSSSISLATYRLTQRLRKTLGSLQGARCLPSTIHVQPTQFSALRGQQSRHRLISPPLPRFSIYPQSMTSQEP